MTHPLGVTSAAERDLTAAFVWYEEQRPGLGDRFIAQADALFGRICEMPKQFPEVVTGYRRGLLHRFPYGVYFSIEPDRVVVHAVLHLHSDPGRWQRRLAGDAG